MTRKIPSKYSSPTIRVVCLIVLIIKGGKNLVKNDVSMSRWITKDALRPYWNAHFHTISNLSWVNINVFWNNSPIHDHVNIQTKMKHPKKCPLSLDFPAGGTKFPRGHSRGCFKNLLSSSEHPHKYPHVKKYKGITVRWVVVLRY